MLLNLYIYVLINKYIYILINRVINNGSKFKKKNADIF
jgi:hypothetical protein